MAKAFTCDLLGAMHPGEGAKEVSVDIGKAVIKAVLYVKKMEKDRPVGLVGPGELSPDAVKKIEAALSTLAEKQK